MSRSRKPKDTASLDASGQPDAAPHPLEHGAEYKVGRGRPPLATRFKPGQSGNLSGRRKTIPLPSEMLMALLHEKTKVKIGGRLLCITQQELFLRTLIRDAQKGEPKAKQLLWNALQRNDAAGAALEALPQDGSSAADQELIEAFLGRNKDSASVAQIDGGTPPANRIPQDKEAEYGIQ